MVLHFAASARVEDANDIVDSNENIRMNEQNIIVRSDDNKIYDAIKYLYHYGYLKSTKLFSKTEKVKEQRIRRALNKFQKFVGLNKTGHLDNVTIKKMNEGRCGNKDIIRDRRGRRYVFEGSHWGKVNISWTISQHSTKFPRHLVYRTLVRAFGVWQQDTPLTFLFIRNGPADIKVGFYRRKHGDDEDFDGPGGILGHGYFPRYGGEVHFDDDEHFSIGIHRHGISLFSTAVHEIGHSLGLKHSYKQDSLMRPFYHLNPVRYAKLGRDDIEGISHIYGKYVESSKIYKLYSHYTNIHSIKQRPKGTTRKTLTNILTNKDLPKSKYSYQPDIRINPTIHHNTTFTLDLYNLRKRPPNLCKDSSIDAAVELANETVLIFKDEWMFHIENSKVIHSKTKRISDFWPSITGKIDGITMDGSGDFYMFQDTKYWILDKNLQIRKNYPNLISKGIPNLGSDNIDAVFHFYLNELPYVFKNDTYWIFKSTHKHPSLKKPISSIFKSCTNCKIPTKIDAAFSSSNGLSYIFVGKEYYRLQNKHPLRIANGFPQDNGKHFFGCI
uniref:ZnMc domain-containing protein n=1 Tax=Parastrongyloides trichosuri TaxID=131310 RepID=A0A0N4ZAI2_PARTI